MSIILISNCYYLNPEAQFGVGCGAVEVKNYKKTAVASEVAKKYE